MEHGQRGNVKQRLGVTRHYAGEMFTHLAMATILVLLLLLLSIVASVLWGLDPSMLYGVCAERACESCTADGMSTWCSGPWGGADHIDMPGRCEGRKLGSSDPTCTTVTPTVEACNASNALERGWQACRGADETNATPPTPVWRQLQLRVVVAHRHPVCRGKPGSAKPVRLMLRTC